GKTGEGQHAGGEGGENKRHKSEKMATPSQEMIRPCHDNHVAGQKTVEPDRRHAISERATLRRGKRRRVAIAGRVTGPPPQRSRGDQYDDAHERCDREESAIAHRAASPLTERRNARSASDSSSATRVPSASLAPLTHRSFSF